MYRRNSVREYKFLYLCILIKIPNFFATWDIDYSEIRDQGSNIMVTAVAVYRNGDMAQTV
jgi:hypothetical protein